MDSTLSLDWRRDHDYYKVQSYLHDYIGYSKKQRLIDDLSDYLLRSKLEWAYKHGESHYSQEVALVTVSEPDTSEILDIGGSIPGDLFVDNFGFILSNFVGIGSLGQSATTTTVTLKDTGGTNRLCTNWASGGSGNKNYCDDSGAAAQGTFMQIGSGSTAPARADNVIQTAFGTSPESAKFATGIGSYSAGSGNVTASGSITSGGSGTINEAVLIQVIATQGGTYGIIVILTHDATTSTAFTAGKSITLQYSIAD